MTFANPPVSLPKLDNLYLATVSHNKQNPNQKEKQSGTSTQYAIYNKDNDKNVSYSDYGKYKQEKRKEKENNGASNSPRGFHIDLYQRP